MYGGPKAFIEIPGGHNHLRPLWLYELISEYLAKKLDDTEEGIPAEDELMLKIMLEPRMIPETERKDIPKFVDVTQVERNITN